MFNPEALKWTKEQTPKDKEVVNFVHDIELLVKYDG